MIDLTDYEPNARQAEAHAAREKFVLYGGATGGGKSVFLVMDALKRCLWWEGNDVGLYRWEFANFKRTTFQTLDEWVLSREGLVSQHNQNEHWLRLCNGSVIRYGGIKPSSAASGDLKAVVKSLEHSVIYLDEVTDVPEEIFDFLPTRIGRVKCKWALTGEAEMPSGAIRCTCNPELGWVKKRWIDQPGPGYRFVRATVRDNAMNLSADYIPTLYASGDKDWVRRYVEGDWSAAVDFAAVFPPELLAKAVRSAVRPGAEVELGVDVGAEGNDPSVVFCRRGWVGEVLWAGHTPNTMALKARIAAYADRLSPVRIKVDCIGVGKGVYDALAEDGYPVFPMVGGAAAENTYGNFRNQRAEIYWGLRKLMEEGKCKLPDDPDLINELGAVRYSQTSSGKTVQIESKLELRKRLGKSPDRADACVYTYAYADSGFLAVGA